MPGCLTALTLKVFTAQKQSKNYKVKYLDRRTCYPLLSISKTFISLTWMHSICTVVISSYSYYNSLLLFDFWWWDIPFVNAGQRDSRLYLQTAVTFRCSEVIILVHKAAYESKSGNCSGTQADSAEPEPQRVWKEQRRRCWWLACSRPTVY